MKPFYPNIYYLVERNQGSKAMGLERIFRLVAAGRKRRNGNNLWSCPLCQHTLISGTAEERDRRAVVHCLIHAGEVRDFPASLAALPQCRTTATKRM
jgi:hypothetical protein